MKYFSEILNPSDPGGEAIAFSVGLWNNGDREEGWGTSVKIEAKCYGSHTTTMKFGSFEQLFEACKKINEELIKEKAIAEFTGQYLGTYDP